jgi:hypothetical protein
VAFRPSLTDFARYQLDHLPLSVVDTLLDCINELSADPYRDPHLRVTLVVPLQRTFPDAYLCGLWAIAYQIRGQDEIIIEAFGDAFY